MEGQNVASMWGAQAAKMLGFRGTTAAAWSVLIGRGPLAGRASWLGGEDQGGKYCDILPRFRCFIQPYLWMVSYISTWSAQI